jgi:mono/diheme cytochrome c family protein
MNVIYLASGTILFPALLVSGQVDASDTNVSAGLVATYRAASGSNSVEVCRIEPTIAFYLRPGESPHPRIASGAWQGEWRGHIQVLRAGAYRFSARVVGRLRVRVGERDVLVAIGSTEQAEVIAGPSIELPAGDHVFRAEFTATENAALVQVFWESPSFTREPLPWMVVTHRQADETPQLARSQVQDRGRFLVEEFSCVACHKPGPRDELPKQLGRREGPDLSRVGERAYAGWIYHWLANPQAFRAQAVMPRMFAENAHGEVERYAVARFLVSLGGPLQPARKPPNENDVKNSVRRGERVFGRVGCAVCHAAPDGKKSFAELKHLGSKTTPDKLAQYLQNPLAIDSSGRMPQMSLDGGEANDLARFLCESTDDAIRRDLREPPGPDSVRAVFRELGPDEKESEKFQSLSQDERIVALGRRLVESKGCANCHRIAPGGQVLPPLVTAPAFDVLRNSAKQSAGCLMPANMLQGHNRTAPRYALNAEHRKCIQAFLTEASDGPGAPAPAVAVQATMRRLNCTGCHARDGQGGLTAENVDELRRHESAQDAESIAPPPLTEVGAKLRTPWLRDVLVNGRRARPWMGLRMPQFGSAHVGGLPELLAAADGAEPSDAIQRFAYDPAHVEAGRLLVGKKGFGCISCHDIAGQPNTGTRGPDLASMNERVRYDWYRRWLDDPQRMQPGTRMPTVFQNGTTAIKAVLDADASAQSDSIWEYLSLGANLPLPEGLERPHGLVLDAKDRPMIVRTFMPDAGSRAVAVGFPAGVSFAYDTAQCRLAYGWTGGFVEASPIWQNRGGSPATVRGPRFWNAPAGLPWEFTDSPAQLPDWTGRVSDPALGAPLPEGKVFEGQPRLRFRNYAMSRDGVPAFRYSLGLPPSDGATQSTVEIHERFSPRQELAGVGVERRFKVRSTRSCTGWLVVAQNSDVVQVLDAVGESRQVDPAAALADLPTAGHSLLLNQGPSGVQIVSLLAAPNDTRWNYVVAENDRRLVLRVPIERADHDCEIAVVIWSPYRNEPAMIRELLSK